MNVEMGRQRYLSRQDVQQQTDTATDSILCRYTGNAIFFDAYLYGYPAGAFYAVQVSDVPWPSEVEETAVRAGVQIDAMVEAKKLQRAVAEALAAEAMVKAPELLQVLTEDSVPEWHVSDLHELQRRHRIADTRVRELIRLVMTELKLRGAGFKTPSLQLPSVADFMPVDPAAPPSEAALVLAEPEPAVPCDPLPPARPLALGTGDDEVVEGEVVEDMPFVPGSAVVERLETAIREARNAELPQRLPGGARRRLQRMPAAAYVYFRDQLEPRADLCSALTDARSWSRKNDEAVVIDYDGEWPVVARRFGQGGRTIYRVEAALRRQG
jgi:hypothetical protein